MAKIVVCAELGSIHKQCLWYIVSFTYLLSSNISFPDPIPYLKLNPEEPGLFGQLNTRVGVE